MYVSKGGGGGGGGGSHCLAFNWVSTLGQRNKSGRITTREVYVSNGFVEQYKILSPYIPIIQARHSAKKL